MQYREEKAIRNKTLTRQIPFIQSPLHAHTHKTQNRKRKIKKEKKSTIAVLKNRNTGLSETYRPKLHPVTQTTTT